MKKNTYKLVRKIHLYASLPVVVLLLMYIISSYFMIHYEYFNTYQRDETTIQIDASTGNFDEEQWSRLLTEYGITGKLTGENSGADGSLMREYSRAGKQHQVKLDTKTGTVEIKTSKSNLPGMVVGWHRIRGFEGSWPYQIYAVLLDVVGVSLILFAITGAILWLKLLKGDPWGWALFIAGFVYVTAVVSYLMIV